MGLYSAGLIIGRIFATEIWGAYFWDGLFFLGGERGGLIIGILRYIPGVSVDERSIRSLESTLFECKIVEKVKKIGFSMTLDEVLKDSHNAVASSVMYNMNEYERLQFSKKTEKALITR